MTTTISSPLQLRTATLENRIAKSAMSERLAGEDGAPNQGHVRLYEQWGRGGTGLLITGNVMIDRRALGESGNVVIEDERHLQQLCAWAQAGKAGGAAMWMQINHPGRQSPRMLSKQPVAPSAVPMKGMPGAFAPPRALQDEEIVDIIERFATAARVAKKAGFDGVQIHGAHGYLVSQFLSPRTNLRSDRWGGDAERRRRFLIEVIRAVRKEVGEGYPIGLKLNSADFQRGGFTEEESLAVVEAVAAKGIDLLEISGGTYESAVMFEESNKRASTRSREAFFLDYAEKVRQQTTLPLMVTGGFRTAAGMNDALAGGAVNVVGMARPLAVEAELSARLLSGESDAAKPVKLATGIKLIDSVVQGAWYQLQIRRMANGLAPKANLSRFMAAVRYFMPPPAFPAIEPPRSDTASPSLAAAE